MPNWCENTLTIQGPADQVAAFVAQAQGTPVDWGDGASGRHALCFHQFVPVPADVVAQGYATAGFAWCVTHWGTKWEPSRLGVDPPYIVPLPDGAATTQYSFNTAWDPPIPWVNAVAAQWPDLLFHLVYGESGVNHFGEVQWAQGALSTRITINPDVNRAWMEEHFAWVLEVEDDE